MPAFTGPSLSDFFSVSQCFPVFPKIKETLGNTGSGHGIQCFP